MSLKLKLKAKTRLTFKIQKIRFRLKKNLLFNTLLKTLTDACECRQCSAPSACPSVHSFSSPSAAQSWDSPQSWTLSQFSEWLVLHLLCLCLVPSSPPGMSFNFHVPSENARSSFKTKVKLLQDHTNCCTATTKASSLHAAPSSVHLCHSQAGKAHLSLLEQGSHVSSFGSTSTALQRVWQKRNSKYLIRKQAKKTLGYHFTSRRLANIRKLDKCWCGYV